MQYVTHVVENSTDWLVIRTDGFVYWSSEGGNHVNKIILQRKTLPLYRSLYNKPISVIHVNCHVWYDL